MQTDKAVTTAAQGQNVRNFGELDIRNNHIITIDGELIDAPLPWQKRGLQQTATGYGAKLTSRRKIQFHGKLYRLYVTCYGNAGSAWFKTQGRTIYVS